MADSLCLIIVQISHCFTTIYNGVLYEKTFFFSFKSIIDLCFTYYTLHSLSVQLDEF